MLAVACSMEVSVDATSSAAAGGRGWPRAKGALPRLPYSTPCRERAAPRLTATRATKDTDAVPIPKEGKAQNP